MDQGLCLLQFTSPSCDDFVLKIDARGCVTCVSHADMLTWTCNTVHAQEGKGPAVAKASNVTVHATGIVKETGKKFWYDSVPLVSSVLCVCGFDGCNIHQHKLLHLECK